MLSLERREKEKGALRVVGNGMTRGWADKEMTRVDASDGRASGLVTHPFLPLLQAKVNYTSNRSLSSSVIFSFWFSSCVLRTFWNLLMSG